MTFLPTKIAAGIFAVTLIGGMVPSAGAAHAGQTTSEFLKSTSIEESVERSRRNRNFYEPTRAQKTEVGQPGGGMSATPPAQHGFEPAARPDPAERRAKKRTQGILFWPRGAQDFEDYASPESDPEAAASVDANPSGEEYWQRSLQKSQNRSRRMRGESWRF